MEIIYSSENKIFCFNDENNSVKEIPCGKIIKYRDTVRSIRQRKEWKTSGSGAEFMGMRSADNIDPDLLPVKIPGLGICDGEIVYAVDLEDVGSVYRRSFDPSDDSEGLIRASNDFVFGSFDIKDGRLALSMGANASFLHIAVMDMQGRFDEYTDGDTIEENPCWSHTRNGIYFSTAGYARDQYGSTAAIDPRSVAFLDLDSRTIADIVYDEKYDFLHPREDKQGNLYYIRQPYGGEKPKSGITFKDIIMFPYRLIKGLFGFLNIFTTLYGGESLKGGGDANSLGDQIRSKNRSKSDIIIEGNIINAEKLNKIENASEDNGSGIMPLSRVLIKRSPDGSEKIIKKGILDFNITDSGEIIFSNGRYISKTDEDGNETRITKAALAVNISIK